jgi:hypothetical protein
MSAEQLSALLELRPDLLDPVPHDIAELASRSTMSTSIARAIDELNAWLRTVAEALAALSDPASLADLATMLGQPRSAGAAAIGQLRERALLWGEDDQLHLVRPVREAFEPYPGGLAPPSARPMSAEQIEAALKDCGAEARVVLERLLWSPTGAVRYADRPVSRSSARSPIERLLSRQLLRPLCGTVIIPARCRGGSGMDALRQSRSPPTNLRSLDTIVIRVSLMGLRPGQPSPCCKTSSCSPIDSKPRRTNCFALVVCRAATLTPWLAI